MLCYNFRNGVAMNKVIKNIYVDDDPNGIIISNEKMSSLTAYIIPRNLLSVAAKKLETENMNNPGVYFLVGEENENSIPEMYIGETSKGINRIFNHDRKKRFWSKSILFLADPKHFDQSFINQLEEYLIRKANSVNRYKLHNEVIPNANKQSTDADYIEKIYKEISFLMETFGYPLENLSSKKNNKLFKTTRRGIEAIGNYYADKFDLLEGSNIDISKKCNLDKYNQMRNELIDSGNLQQIDNAFILKKTLSFKTPSGASDFVLGGSTNGWLEWKDENGKTLDELYRK